MLALAVLGLIFVGLVAVAGFTVLARRRLRALGMLGSLGAADRRVRLVMTANGAIAGLTGTLAGAKASFAAWFAYRPYLETSAGHQIDPLHLPVVADRDQHGPRRRNRHRRGQPGPPARWPGSPRTPRWRAARSPPGRRTAP